MSGAVDVSGYEEEEEEEEAAAAAFAWASAASRTPSHAACTAASIVGAAVLGNDGGTVTGDGGTRKRAINVSQRKR